MSVSRHQSSLRDEIIGRGKRVLRSMLSTVALVAYEASERVTFRGREAADGSADEDSAEQYREKESAEVRRQEISDQFWIGLVDRRQAVSI